MIKMVRKLDFPMNRRHFGAFDVCKIDCPNHNLNNSMDCKKRNRGNSSETNSAKNDVNGKGTESKSILSVKKKNNECRKKFLSGYSFSAF